MNEYVGPPSFCLRSCSNVPSRSQRSSTRCSSATWSGSAGTGAKAGSAGIGRLMVAAQPSAVTAAGYHACPSRPLALDATKTSRARARRRGSRRAAPVGPCARRGRALDRSSRRSPAPQIQQSPAIAVDPDAPLRAGGRRRRRQRRAAVPHTATASTADWSTRRLERAAGVAAALAARRPPARPTSPGASTPARRRTSTRSRLGSYRRHLLCTGNSGVFFSTPRRRRRELRHRAAGQLGGSTSSESLEPAIAVDRCDGPRLRRLRQARLFGQPGAPGARTARRSCSRTRTTRADPGPAARVSPLATSGSAHYRSPSVAVLPDGRVIVAFRNDAQRRRSRRRPAPRRARRAGTTAASGAGLVGPSTVVGDATAPALVSGIAGPPTPSVVAAGGRVTVAWHAGFGRCRARVRRHVDRRRRQLRARRSRSTRPAPATRSHPTRRHGRRTRRRRLPLGSAGHRRRRRDVRLGRPAAAGRHDRGLGQPRRRAVGRARPERRRFAGTGATRPPARRRDASVPTAAEPAAADRRRLHRHVAGGQDVHVVGLLHGTSAPVIAPQTVTASKNATTIVHVDATDADGDPLTWSTGAQPTTPARA